MDYTIISLDHTQIKDLKDIAFEFASEAGKTLNWNHWSKVNAGLIENNLSICEAVYLKDKIIGFGIVHFFPDFLSGDLYGIDGAFFISKKYRGYGCAGLLLDVLEMNAKGLKAKKIIMIALDSVQDGKAGVFFKRKGYKPLETSYEKVL